MAPTKRDEAGSGRMGITDHRQRSVRGSMLVLGANLWLSRWTALPVALEGADAANQRRTQFGRGMPILLCSCPAGLLSRTRPIESNGGRLTEALT